MVPIGSSIPTFVTASNTQRLQSADACCVGLGENETKREKGKREKSGRQADCRNDLHGRRGCFA